MDRHSRVAVHKTAVRERRRPLPLRPRVRAELGGDCPALIVHGSQDAAISPARAEQMRDGLAGPARSP